MASTIFKDSSTAQVPNKKKKITVPYTFKTSHIPTYLVLIIGAIFAVIPFLWMVSTSLMTLGETINKQLIPASPNWANYSEAWNDANFSKYFLNSVLITVSVLVGLLINCVLAAYAFAKIEFPGRNFIFAVLLATMMIPEAVTIIPQIKLIRGEIFPLPYLPETWTFVPMWLREYFPSSSNWMNTLQVLTIPFMANAFSIFLLRQFFIRIPDDIWDAARIDGAGHLRYLWQIVVPMSKPVIMTVTLFAFIGSWNAFMWPLLVTTTAKWRPLMVGLWTFVTEAGPETQLLMAGAMITIIPVLIVFFITQKEFTEGIATSGLKG